MYNPQEVQKIMEKWGKVLNHKSLPDIKNPYIQECVAKLLENQERDATGSQSLFEAAPTNVIGSYTGDGTGIGKFDPVLIALVRRAMPQLIAYDVCGVQPMNLPTGLIFAMRARYGAQNSGVEALFNEADTDFSGTGTHAGSNPTSGTDTTGTGMTVANAEVLGASGSFGEMSITIERVSVTAQSRALKASYSLELAQDMKNLHGLNAEQELTNILSEEILFEINREIIRTIYYVAKAGAQIGTAVAGTFNLDTDSNGRWSEERFKGLLFQLERERNAIAQQTRRGRGNFIICTSDVAAALNMTGKLSYAPALKTDLKVDEANSTFAGVMQDGVKVYIDPYSANQSANQYALVGYKGSSPYDAGIFYAPYVPLQKVQAIDPATFQPAIGFKTRYGIVANPFAEGTTSSLGALNAGANVYYRLVKVTNLM